MTIHCTNHNNEILQMVQLETSTNFEKHFKCPGCLYSIIIELDEKEEQCLTKQKEPASRAE